MGYEHPTRAFAPLPGALRPIITQADVANLFAKQNEDLIERDPHFYFAYCRSTRAWHVATDAYCTQWRSPEWSDAHPHHYQQ